MTSLGLVLSRAKIPRSESSPQCSSCPFHSVKFNCTRWSPRIPTTPRSWVDDIQTSKPHPAHTRVIYVGKGVIGNTLAKLHSNRIRLGLRLLHARTFRHVTCHYDFSLVPIYVPQIISAKTNQASKYEYDWRRIY